MVGHWIFQPAQTCTHIETCWGTAGAWVEAFICTNAITIQVQSRRMFYFLWNKKSWRLTGKKKKILLYMSKNFNVLSRHHTRFLITLATFSLQLCARLHWNSRNVEIHHVTITLFPLHHRYANKHKLTQAPSHSITWWQMWTILWFTAVPFTYLHLH